MYASRGAALNVLPDHDERSRAIRWRKLRHLRGGIEVSVSLKPRDRLMLDKLAQRFNMRRQEVLRLLLRTAHDELERSNDKS